MAPRPILASLVTMTLSLGTRGQITPRAVTSIVDLPLSSASDVNNAGQITGTILVGPTPHAALLVDGAVRDLGALLDPGATSYADRINASGQVLGHATIGAEEVAFIWSPDVPNGTSGTVGQLPSRTPDGALIRFGALNDRGDAAGSTDSATPGAVVWTNGQLVQLGSFWPDGYSQAFGINNFGQVIGTAWNAIDADQHAFLWTPDVQNGTTGTMVDFSAIIDFVPGVGADAINDRGQISGTTLFFGAFVWSPSSPNVSWGTMSWLGSMWATTGINEQGQVLGWITVPSDPWMAVFHAALFMPDAGMLDLGPHDVGATQISRPIALTDQRNGETRVLAVISRNDGSAGPDRVVLYTIGRKPAPQP